MDTKNPLTLDDYYNFKFIASTTVSNDGSKIAYTLLTYHDVEKKDTKDQDSDQFPKEERSNVWVFDIKSKESKQFTFGKVNLSPSWSPDEKTLAFISKRSNESQIYLISLDGGEAQQLTNLKLGVSSTPVWSPDGKNIAFSASSLEKEPDTKKPYRYKRDFYRLDASGNVDHFRQDIYTITVSTKEVKKITNDDKHHANPRWSPDGTMLLWQTSFATKGIDVFNSIVSIQKNGTITEHLDAWGYATLVEWYTNDVIVFQGREKDRIIGSKDDIFVYNIFTQEIECRSKSCKLGIDGHLEAFMPGPDARMNKLVVKEDMVHTYLQDKGKLCIYSFKLTGKEDFKEIVGGERACYLQDIIDNKVIFLSSNPTSPPELFSYDITASREEQLTFVNREFLETKILSHCKSFEITGKDGVKTDGWILEPQTKPPYPTLLKIHGGPHSGYGFVFQWDAQLLSNAGYAILMVNHRGSTGYGDTFATAIIGDWGNLDYNDLMAGVDKGIELGLIDPNRLGCFGISGGGNLSSWIVGNTTRFKAAVPENPLTNWLSFYGVSDIGRWFAINEVGGLPHEVPEKYVKTSPVTYAHKCTTPTLMIQHDNDLRCPVEQSEQFYAILRDAGCIVEMLRMPGTPHGGSVRGPLEIRQARSEALLEWFKKYV